MSEEAVMGTDSCIDQAALDAIAGNSNSENVGDGGAVEVEKVDVPTSEIILPVVCLLTGVAAPNWNITEEENRVLSESYSSLVDKYFPAVGKGFSIELNALVITAAIFLPRIGKPRVLRVKEREEGEVEAVSVKEEVSRFSGSNPLDSFREVERVNGEMVQ